MSKNTVDVKHIDTVNHEARNVRAVAVLMAEFFEGASQDTLMNLDGDGMAVIFKDIARRVKQIDEHASTMWREAIGRGKDVEKGGA